MYRQIHTHLCIRHGVHTSILNIGEATEYRPFGDLRSVPEARRPREQVENHGRACTHCSGPFSK
jgi:hypothetical protein